MTLYNMQCAALTLSVEEMNICLAALSALIHLMHPGQRRGERNMQPAVVHASKRA